MNGPASDVRDLPPILKATDIVKSFGVRSGLLRQAAVRVRALDGVSVTLHQGETLAVVGESGSGKSTLARILVGLEHPDSGSATLDGRPIFEMGPSGWREARRVMQMVFQDAYGSLDPRMTVYQLVSEPWDIHGGVMPKADRYRAVARLLEQVGLDPSDAHRLPNTFSGGQRQRIGIARALALSPRILILDEPVSALDVSIQAQIIELLRELQTTTGLAILLIAHDLAVVRSIAHTVAVMYLGRIVEAGPADRLYADPQHPYTKALLSAVPGSTRGASRIHLTGEVPSPMNVPSGCRFHTRCWLSEQLRHPEICSKVDPTYRPGEEGHIVACHFPLDGGQGRAS